MIVTPKKSIKKAFEFGISLRDRYPVGGAGSIGQIFMMGWSGWVNYKLHPLL